MPPYPNLISESILISETIQLLQSVGGRASAVKVVDYVMKIRQPEPELAKLLVSDLIEIDPRLQLNEDYVELIQENLELRMLAETDFVVFDLETTGAKTPPCRITEIGAYRVRHGKITGEFHTLVNPETMIPIFISQLTGITDKMVRQAPKFRDIAADFLDFIGDSVLVAHNAHFDIRFLNHEIGRIYANYRVANPHLCTVQLSRKLLPHIDNHRLNTVAEYFSVALINHHRASEDARATAHIFVNLLEELETRGINDLATAKRFKF
ncbi:MAG: exonuclease domain-containing protein [Acidobacteriota bacterium]|nr:exonuclease domain-containing protein [Acidobacteriota bacterium]